MPTTITKILRKYRNLPIENEKGAASLLVIIIIFGFSFTLFRFIQVKAVQNLEKLVSGGLEESKLLVSRSLAYQVDCNSVDFSTSCPSSPALELYDRRGNIVIAGSGSKIGDWDVRVRCDSAGVYQVEVARLKDNDNFKINRLTKKEYSWEVMNKLESLCFRDRQVVAAAPCYATQAQEDYLPPHLLAICQSMSPPGGFCNTTYYHQGKTYCPNDIGNYPGCPRGYQPELNYIDRFGWGGIDFTKMTVCVKTVAANKPEDEDE